MTRMAVDLLLSGGTIITMDSQRRILRGGAVAIHDGKIAAVGPCEAISSTVHAEEEWKLEGRLILPGLVNVHTHLYQTLMRGYGDDLAGSDWFGKMMLPMSVVLTEEDCYTAAVLGCAEAALSGTTTIVDFMQVHPRPGLSDAIIRGIQTVGLRGVFVRGMCTAGLDRGVPKVLVQDPETCLGDAERLLSRADSRVDVWVAPYTSWAVSELLLEGIREISGRFGTRVAAHVSETQDQVADSERRFGVRDFALYDRHGLITGCFQAIHGVLLTESEISRLATVGGSLAHCPISNMYGGSPTACVLDFLRAGVLVGLGTDGAASNNTQDMFDVMRVAALIQKSYSRRSDAFTAAAVLEMATIVGAEAIGMADEVGSIEVGKQADIVVYDPAVLRSTPETDPLSVLVYAGSGSAVETVLMDGRPIVRDYRLTTVDVRVLREDAEHRSTDLASRAGVTSQASHPWRGIQALRKELASR